MFKTFKSNVTLVDIGASGGVHHRWKLLGDKLKIVGFEPDTRAFNLLPKSKNAIWLNKAVYNDNDAHTLYITRHQTNVSMLKPNLDVIGMLCLKSEDFDIIDTISVECERLDDILEREKLRANVLKIDTQGTELQILQGAERSLEQDVFAIEVEVEFVELYDNQPLFTNIHNYLLGKGFDLMDYGNMVYMKGKHAVGIGGEKCFLVAADALYFKRLNQINKILPKGDTNALERIIMGCLAYGYSDYALELCFEIKREGLIPVNQLDIYMAQLSKIKHYSKYIPNFPGKAMLSKGFGLLKSLLTPVQDAYWINRLGNHIRLYRW